MPIRVLHVTSLEKSNYFLNNIAENVSPDEIKLYALNLGRSDDFLEQLAQRNVKTFAVGYRSRFGFPKVAVKISQIIKEERIDIVHAHLFDPSLVSLPTAKWNGVAKVITRHHSDLIYQIANSLKRQFYLSLERFINYSADHIIAPSQMVRDVVVTRQHVPEEKVTVIPYGQSTERFAEINPQMVEEVRNELRMSDQLSIVYTARLDHLKGHRYLFEALASLAKSGLTFRLFLVGEGPDRDLLGKLAEENNLADQTSFLGWRRDALEIMAAADVVVQPSLSEALSSVTIEALMLEKPIVATDVSGVRDTLDNGRYGKIVPPADAESLYEALLETIQNLDEMRTRAKEGRRYVSEYMSAKRVADQYTRIYQELLK